MKCRLGCFKSLLAACAVALSLPAASQTLYKSHIWIGGHAGATLARQDLSPSVPQSWLLGTTAAASFRYAEEKLFGIVAELGCTTRGWKEDFQESPLKYSRSLTYITLPVMTHINFGGRRAKCFFNLGPEFCYMIASHISANFNYSNPGPDTQWPERDRMTEQLDMPVANRFDYGITAGVGGEFYLTPRQSITLEVRYYFGLGNIFHSSKADVFSASRSTSLEATVGYYFRLK